MLEEIIATEIRQGHDCLDWKRRCILIQSRTVIILKKILNMHLSWLYKRAHIFIVYTE